MRALVLGSRPTPTAGPHELDDLVQVAFVCDVLNRLGIEARPLWVDLDMAATKRAILDARAQVVFNLVEGIEGDGSLIHLVPSLLDSLGVTYTGCPSQALFICSNKPLCKTVMRFAGLPTPDWVTTKGGDILTYERGGSFIIKTAFEHSSFGLDENSVTEAKDIEWVRRELERRSRLLGKEFFAEHYIDGREFNVSLLEGPSGVEVLPIAEISFQGYGPERPRIVCFKAKWDPMSFEYWNTPRTFEYEDAPAIKAALEPLARKCWELFGLRGYARVDFRFDQQGKPWILEVNPNPCISPDAGFMASVHRAGLSSEETISRILLASGITPPGSIMGKPPDPPPTLTLRGNIEPKDIKWIRQTVISTGVFSPREVDIAVEVAQEALHDRDTSCYRFFFAEIKTEPVGYACFGPIPCTEGSFDLYWIAVDPRYQKRGVGRYLLRAVESHIVVSGGRRLFVETSSRDDYRAARGFYMGCGYTPVAVVRNFYAEGEDKVIFLKELMGLTHSPSAQATHSSPFHQSS